MTQPPGGYPPPEPGEQHPPPADPFYAPPSWEPPTVPNRPASPGPQSAQPTQPIPPPPSYSPPPPPPPGGPYAPPPGDSPYQQPSSPYLPPGSGMPYGYPAGGPPPRRRRGPMIAAIVAAVALLVLAGGGVATWLLTRDPDRDGAASPTAAVESFLQAVYVDQDPNTAADLVCSEARDEASIETKINEIRSYQQTQVNPTFSWTEPAVVDQTEQLAVVQVTVTMVTGDEKTADQSLQVSVLDKDANGWWVCDLQTIETTTEQPGDGSQSGTPSPTPSAEGE